MKKLLCFIWLILFVPLVACADQYKEGTHYEMVSQQATAKPEVWELFSFWCPACYNFEPIAKAVEDNLSESAKFSKVHVDFMQFAAPELQRDLTKAMLAGKALKMDEKINKAIFEYIHKQRAKITSLRDVRNIVQIQGVDIDKFDNAMSSFAVNGMFNKNQKTIESLRGKVTGVPTFVVNGKYKVITNSVRSLEELQKLIDHLLQLKD